MPYENHIHHIPKPIMTMENHRNWEEHILSFLKGLGLGDLVKEDSPAILRLDRFLIINSSGIKITFSFDCHHRQLLKKVVFRSELTNTRIPFCHEGDYIPYDRDTRQALESFLYIPLVQGWIEDRSFVRDRHYRTYIYTDFHRQDPFYTLRGERSPAQRIRSLLNIKVTREFIRFKSILLQHEEKAGPYISTGERSVIE